MSLKPCHHYTLIDLVLVSGNLLSVQANQDSTNYSFVHPIVVKLSGLSLVLLQALQRVFIYAYIGCIFVYLAVFVADDVSRDT